MNKRIFTLTATLTVAFFAMVFGIISVSGQTPPPDCVEFPLNAAEAVISFGGDAEDWNLGANAPSTGYSWVFDSIGDPEDVVVPAGYRLDHPGGQDHGPTVVTDVEVATMWQLTTVVCHELVLGGPLQVDPGQQVVYTSNLTPITTTLPLPTVITQTWEVSDPAAQVVDVGDLVVVWGTEGTQEVTSTVEYRNITLQSVLPVQVGTPTGEFKAYLPAVSVAPIEFPVHVSAALCNTYNPRTLFANAQWDRLDDPDDPNDGCGWRLVDYDHPRTVFVQPGARLDHEHGSHTGPVQLLNWSAPASIWIEAP